MANVGFGVRRPALLGQLLVGLALFGVYLLVDRDQSAARHAAAVRHGRAVLDLERHLHLDLEWTLNGWLQTHRVLSILADYEYAYTYILSAALVLVWVWVRRPEVWAYARDSFLVLNLLAFAAFWLFPTAPPRMLADQGFVDTVTRRGTVGSWGSGPVDTANQLAAMPSLHIGWALWVSVVLARLTARRSAQLLSAVHVLLTLYVVLATANHFLLDALAAVPVVLIAERISHLFHDGPPGEVVASNDAFFLHVESTGAAQHVGGLALLDASGDDPSLTDVRALVSHRLVPIPRFRQRLVTPSRWRRPRWIEDDDVDVDVDAHVTETRVEGPTGLQRLLGELAQDPLPRGRPLWRVLMVRGVAAPGQPAASALVLLVHHAVADGIGTVMNAMRLFDPLLPLPVPPRSGPGRLARAAAVTLGLAQLATDGRAGAVGEPSSRRGFAVVDVGLDCVRRAASARGARVTDLVIAVTVDAVSRVAPGLVQRAGGSLRVSVPLMLRAPDTGAQGNATSAIIVSVPVGSGSFDELLAVVTRRTQRLRRPTRALAARFVMATGLRLLPEPCAAWFARTVYGARFLHLVVSNMPGPIEELGLLGHPLRQVYPILPIAPGTPLALGALSWHGVLGLGLATDPDLLEVGDLADAFGRRFAELDDETAAYRPGGAVS
ncbi:MAG TPA: phosphatase PAP2 family protein [Nocardioides sp.]|nr:phosphatase PAP2 family protein [Nocardioides sp.]